MSELRIEGLFRFLDELFRLSEIPNVIMLALSTIFTFSLSAFFLYRIANRHVNSYEEVSQSTRIGRWLLLYALSSLLMMIGLVYSFRELTVDTLLVFGVLIQVFTLTLTSIKFKGPSRSFLLFLFYLSLMFFVIFFSSKVSINGIDATETTTDTLQIYYEGRFYFSRHAGWYDLAPVDAIAKNVLMYILGINYPYDPTVTTLMFSTLSISVSIALLALVKRLSSGDLASYALALMLLVVHPYALLIGMSTPPTNFSLVYSMFALLLISKEIYGIERLAGATLVVVIVFTIIAVLAHPMSIIIPVYLLAIVLYEVVHIKGRYEAVKCTFMLLTLSSIVFMVKALYTGLREGFLTLINIIVEGLTSLLTYGIKEISVYIGGPQPPKSTLFSFGAFPGIILAILLTEVVRELRKKKADKLSIYIFSAVLIMSALSVITNFFHPSSRYLGYPAIVLGAFQTMIYVINLPKSKWRSVFIILLGILCVSSVLSPNAMIEHYNIFTGGRWPRIENFVLSNFLIEHIDVNYVVDVFRGHQEARLHLYFTHDILLYGHPYHHVNVLIVEKFLIPGVIKARSYWDFVGRLFVRYEGYIDSIDEASESIVFNGWKWIATWS